MLTKLTGMPYSKEAGVASALYNLLFPKMDTAISHAKTALAEFQEGTTPAQADNYAQDDKGDDCHAERSEASVQLPVLTDREASVLPLLAEGLTSKEIASKLFLTEQTIKWYRMRLLDKFKARNTAELLSKAREAGML